MDEFLRYIRMFRLCWFGGRPGGGKTSFAIYVAGWLLSQRHCSRIAANFPLASPFSCVESGLDSEDVQGLTDVAIILDEAWQELGKGHEASVRAWLAYPRKRNQFLLMPSVLPLSSSVSLFRVARSFNGLLFGLPVWRYSWEISGLKVKGKNLTGAVNWWHPGRIFSAYDSNAFASDSWSVWDLGGG